MIKPELGLGCIFLLSCIVFTSIVSMMYLIFVLGGYAYGYLMHQSGPIKVFVVCLVLGVALSALLTTWEWLSRN